VRRPLARALRLVGAHVESEVVASTERGAQRTGHAQAGSKMDKHVAPVLAARRAAPPIGDQAASPQLVAETRVIVEPVELRHMPSRSRRIASPCSRQIL